jgi:hypothetical protein
MTATTGSFSGALTASAGITVSGGPITGSSGLTISAGTSSLQAVTATTGAFSGGLTLTGQTVVTGGAVLANTGSSFTSVPASPAGAFTVLVNGVTAKVPYYV